MICEKKEASIYGLTNVFEFFNLPRACEAASLTKISMESM